MTKPKVAPSAKALWDILAKLEDLREAAVDAHAAGNYGATVRTLSELRHQANEARAIALVLRTQQERQA